MTYALPWRYSTTELKGLIFVFLITKRVCIETLYMRIESI